MQTILYPLLSFLMIGAFVLRFFLFRPHWLANIVTFFVTIGCIIPLSGNSIPSEGRLGVAAGVALIIFCLHLFAKRYDKKRAAKKAARQAPLYTPPAVPTQPMVAQTLTTCLRCGSALHGPICTACGFDHTAESLFFLTPVEPARLQIPAVSKTQQPKS